MEGTWQLHLKGEFQLSLFVTKSPCRHGRALCTVYTEFHVFSVSSGHGVTCKPDWLLRHRSSEREREGQEQQLCVRRTWLRSTLMPAVTIVKERESSSHQEHQNPATKSCHLWSVNVSLSLWLAGFVSRLWSSGHHHILSAQHNSHDSTAAANCSYDRNIGGGGGGWEYGPIPTPHSDFERRN